MLVFCSSFIFYEVSWVRREANSTAHRLARFVLLNQTDGFVSGSLPDEVLSPSPEEGSLC